MRTRPGRFPWVERLRFAQALEAGTQLRISAAFVHAQADASLSRLSWHALHRARGQFLLLGLACTKRLQQQPQRIQFRPEAAQSPAFKRSMARL